MYTYGHTLALHEVLPVVAQRDDAITVVAIDLRGAAGHRDVSDIVERHRSALSAADGQLPDRFRGSARRRIQLHAHVDLTAGQVQPWQIEVIVANGRHTDDVADRRRGDTERRRTREEIGSAHV